MRMLMIILSAIVVMVILGCSDSTGTSKIESLEDYFPMAAGLSWSYLFYDLEGNPKYDSLGNPTTASYNILEEVAQYENCYNIQFYSLSTSPEPENPEPEYFIDFQPSNYIINEFDSIVIHLDNNTQLNNIQLTSEPFIEFNDPTFSADGLTITFTHSELFQSFLDYEFLITVNLTFYGNPINESLSYYFRTTSPSFEPDITERVCRITDDAIYRFDSSVEYFDIANTDSLDILLQSPLEIGHEWIFNSSEGENYGAEIISIGTVEVESVIYDNVVKVGYNWGWNSDYYWFAPNVGIIKTQESNFTANLTNN